MKKDWGLLFLNLFREFIGAFFGLAVFALLVSMFGYESKFWLSIIFIISAIISTRTSFMFKLGNNSIDAGLNEDYISNEHASHLAELIMEGDNEKING